MAASGLTYLQIVNRVLERLRESTVATYAETVLSTLIAATVNAVKSDIESAWQWHAMRETFTVATTNNTSSYSMTGSRSPATILDAWNTTTGQELCRGTVAGFNQKFFGVGSNAVQTGSPTEYLKSGLDANFDITVDVWPIPVTGNLDTLKFNLYVPQADLSSNATVPLVPQTVLIEETIARVQNERGEEGAPKPMPGETFIMQDLLDSAIAADGGTAPEETDWQVE